METFAEVRQHIMDTYPLEIDEEKRTSRKLGYTWGGEPRVNRQFLGVQCEACHGYGTQHARDGKWAAQAASSRKPPRGRRSGGRGLATWCQRAGRP